MAAISRYRSINIVSGSYETFEFPKIDFSQISTVTIAPGAEDRLDTLAFKYYGSGEYWWVIAYANDLQWGFDFIPGETLKIPVNLDDVLKYF